MREIQGMQGMFTRIVRNLNAINLTFLQLGIVQKDPEKCSRRFQEMFERIPGNVQEESKECSKSFSAMFQNIRGYVWKDYGECLRRLRECYQRFLEMLSKNPGNVQEDLGECKFRFFFDEIFLVFIKLCCKLL